MRRIIMSWVSIEKDECTECGLCVTRCIRCFSDNGGEIVVDANEDNCNLCGHCVALCPTMAITHHKMNMDDFIELDKEIGINTDQLVQLIRRRRSHRDFTDKEIPRKDLETLVDICSYCPTGSNVQNVGIVVIQNRDKIRRLSDLTIESFQKAAGILKQRADRLKAEGKDIPEELNYRLARLNDMNLIKEAKESGLDPVFYKAPVVMVFHSPGLTSAPKDNCMIAAQTVVLTAMTMGLETCYIGIFEAASTYPPIIEELQLPPDHRVLSVLIMGYPTLTYLRAVDRKPMTVRWDS
jgi:nitroreductase/NAD-dependent dihydropyrimidine dehydrogenase PreA subunit